MKNLKFLILGFVMCLSVQNNLFAAQLSEMLECPEKCLPCMAETPIGSMVIKLAQVNKEKKILEAKLDALLRLNYFTSEHVEELKQLRVQVALLAQNKAEIESEILKKD
jgi:hypothetical protein